LINSASYGAAAAEPVPRVRRVRLPTRRELRDASVHGGSAHDVAVRHWDQPLLPRRPGQPDEAVQEQSDQLQWQKWYDKKF
jgi:hypothetical protein